MPPSRTLPASRWLAPPAKTQRTTRVMAVFSDEWNWSFSNRNARSRRWRFPNSGEIISGFTAVFCDDWKDVVDEEEDIDNYIWPSQCESKSDMGRFGQGSSQRYKKQRQKRRCSSTTTIIRDLSVTSPESWLSVSATSPVESVSSTAASPEPQISLSVTSPKPQFYEVQAFESEKWPPSEGEIQSNVTSFLLPKDQEDFLTPGSTVSRHTLPYVPGLVRLMDIDIAAQNKVDWDAYGELRSVEAENPSTSVTSLDFKTISSNDMLHSRKAASCHQWSPEEEPAVEIEGFGIWESFMKCYAGVDGDHDTKECQGTDTLKDSRFEVDLKEIING